MAKVQVDDYNKIRHANDNYLTVTNM